MRHLDETSEMQFWADMNDNRFKSALTGVVDAVFDCEDDDTLRSVANRLKFLSGAVNSHRQRIRSQSG